jgi:preprotein translocase subunit SecB
MSSETPNAETFLYVKEYLGNYNLNIQISSKPLKNRMIEIVTKMNYQDNGKSKNKSYFEINYATIIKVDEEVKDKKIIEKIVLCDVQNKIYPSLERIFINLLTDSGYPGVRIQKKVDFNDLYNKRSN